jgi:hypothetical protein
LHLVIPALFNLAAMTAAYVPCPIPYFPIPYGCYCGITITPPPQPPIDVYDQECKDHDQVSFDWIFIQMCFDWLIIDHVHLSHMSTFFTHMKG